MSKQFTSKQRSVLAKKMGYEGPMQGFDEFLNSRPELQAQYNAVTDEFVRRMNTGGLVKMAVGGAVPPPQTIEGEDNASPTMKKPKLPQPEVAKISSPAPITPITPPPLPVESSDIPHPMMPGGTAYVPPHVSSPAPDMFIGGTPGFYAPGGAGYVPPPVPAELKPQPPVATITPPPSSTIPAPTSQFGNIDSARYTQFSEIGGKPITGPAAQVQAEQITTQQGQFLTSASLPAMSAAQVGAFTPAQAAQAGGGYAGPAATMTGAAVTPQMQQVLQSQQAAQGGVSGGALAQGAQGQLSKGAMATAAQGSAVMATAAKRGLQQGELIDGTTVDQNRVNQAMQEFQAQQGTVTDEMTTTGQLNKMMANFDAGNPPPWAAAAIRAANAQMAARGVGASSMAGQAIVQAAMEAAVPIASMDAKVFETMGLTNLSNRQQTAMLAAQQRAQFLGQEFDQAFQTKVMNAAKISDIANMNFNAEQQVVLENSRAANTMNLANLNNQQAMIMANAATIANMDMANLNNRQQAAMQNAQAFLQMDMQNLQGAQQMSLFKAQSLSQSLLSDAAAENAARQFNASSVNQANQFNAQLATQVSQFNASQQNAMAQFNIGETNAVAKFNAEVQNRRDEFNANQRLVIDQANAQWLKEISVQNTASKNAANYLNAQQLQQMTMAEYNNEVQLYRDQIDYAFKAYENDAERMAALARTELQLKASVDAAKEQSKAAAWAQAGQWFSRTDMGKNLPDWLGKAVGSAAGAAGSWLMEDSNWDWLLGDFEW
jgi:hypothetical protein